MRKRPLFREEAEVGEFDVVTACPHGSLIAACRMRADLRSPFLATHYSPLYAFDEHTTNEEVVARIGLDEVRGEGQGFGGLGPPGWDADWEGWPRTKWLQ